jgi:RNA polymerase sigma factor (sigma-70 family)
LTATVPGLGLSTHEAESSAVNVEAAYGAHSARCYALALHIVRDRHLAQDVLQDVFETLHHQAGRFDAARGSMVTWLLTLTHHKSVDLVRRQRRHTRGDAAEATPTSLVDLSLSAEDSACRNDDAARVRSALQQLGPDKQQVILLAYFGGYTQVEISQRLGAPLGTVKSRTLHALRDLHGYLEPRSA